MKARTRISLTLADALVLLVSFSLAVLLKPSSGIRYFSDYAGELTLFIFLWLIVSTLTRKLDAGRFDTIRKLNTNILLTNLFILSLSVLAMYAARSMEYSRFIVFGTIVIATFLELILVYVYFYLKHAKTGKNGFTFPEINTSVMQSSRPVQEKEPVTIEEHKTPVKGTLALTLVAEAGKEVYEFIHSQMSLSNGDPLVLSTTTQFNIDRLPQGHHTNIVNLKRINDIRYVNKFFESVNGKIPHNGIFIGCVETKEQRKQRILKKYPPVLNKIYYFMDFVVKRIFPKFNITKQIYFFLTRGNNRVISKAETLGRLYACGYEIADHRHINGQFYFAARKIKEPAFDENPTYGPFIKLPRIGKNGRMILVYKLRTMHPFAEYIQDYVYSTNRLQNGGKFNNDFRITTLGKICRKFWLDEVPMLINLCKGEMKLFGVRPLSEHYFGLYSEKLQNKRIQYQPGLIPPYYADLPETLEEIEKSELRYLESYDKHPFLTDWSYFWKAFYNIVFRKARSR